MIAPQHAAAFRAPHPQARIAMGERGEGSRSLFSRLNPLDRKREYKTITTLDKKTGQLRAFTYSKDQYVMAEKKLSAKLRKNTEFLRTYQQLEATTASEGGKIDPKDLHEKAVAAYYEKLARNAIQNGVAPVDQEYIKMVSTAMDQARNAAYANGEPFGQEEAMKVRVQMLAKMLKNQDILELIQQDEGRESDTKRMAIIFMLGFVTHIIQSVTKDTKVEGATVPAH